MAVRCHLKRLRTGAGLTQAQLGERAGILQENVSLIERGDRVPSKSQLHAIATALGVTSSDIYSPEVIREIEAAEVAGA